MIDAGSTELNNLWKDVLHNQAEDYIIPESDVNVMCPYDCVSTSGNTVTGYSAESYCNVNALATGTTTINRNKKIATFEWNYWVLDGTFEVLDDNETVKGFVSTLYSNENCEFSTSPFIFFDTGTVFPLRKNQTLKFNPPTNEIPASITIQSASGGGVLNSIDFNIEEMLEEDNLTEREYVNLFSDSIDTSTTNTRAVIIFTKTLMPYRRARLTEYNNGYKFFKNKYDLQTFVHTRSAMMTMEELPQNSLEISFYDELGLFDKARVDSLFKINFTRNHRFFIYYGYNFDEYGWSYVQADVLYLDELNINRDNLETTFKMESTLQLYNTCYSASWLEHAGGTPNWTSFRGFLNKICDYLGISHFTFDSATISYLDSSFSKWQNFLYLTTTADNEFQKLPMKELIQQIVALLCCVLVRQADGTFYVKNLRASTFPIVDTFIADSIISYPTTTKGEAYKYVTINTPRIYSGQNDDESVSDEDMPSIVFLPTRKQYTISTLDTGDSIDLTQKVAPLSYSGDSSCWLWGAQLWENYAYTFSAFKQSTSYEFGEMFLNPLLQVGDYVGGNVGTNYKRYQGLIEKIEINYDGSFKGSMTLLYPN